MTSPMLRLGWQLAAAALHPHQAKESVAGAAGRGLSKEHKVIRSTYKGLGGAPG